MADCPYEIVSDGMEQTDDVHLVQASHDHAAEPAVLDTRMYVLSVTAASVDRLSVPAFHACAPVLQTLRLGDAVAFVSRLAFRFGSLLAGGRRAEHLHRRMSVRKTDNI